MGSAPAPRRVWTGCPVALRLSLVLEVNLLGAVGARALGADLGLGPPRQQGLLAWLALASPRVSSMESIEDAIWGADPPASARNAVQVYISGLRKQLSGHGALVSRVGDGYALRGDELVVDVIAFAEAVASGRSAIRVGDVDRGIDQLERAIAMWVGHPLDGVGDLPFVGPARENLVNTLRSGLADLASTYLRRRRSTDAVAVAHQLLELDRYDEAAWVQLATAHYAGGNQAEALQVCRRGVALIRDELGVDPHAALGELEMQILRGEVNLPAAQADPETAAEASSEVDDSADEPLPPLPTPFLGREELLEDLDRLCVAARVVTLTGLGGIGKTSVALARAHQVQQSGGRVAFVPLEAETSLSGAMERLCAHLRRDPGSDALAALRDGEAWPATLVVLDNAEQIPELRVAVDRLVADIPNSRFLITSRLPLRAHAEVVLTVPPLQGSSAGSSAAVELFTAHALRARSDLDVDRHREAIEQLCSTLDGIPLSIEVAAARSRILMPEQMLERLRRSTSSLDGARGTHRQANLTVVLAATMQLLSPPARTMLRSLAELEGRATVGFIEALMGEEADELVDALDELASGGLVLVSDGLTRLPVPVRDHCRGLLDREEMTRRFTSRAVAYALEGPSMYGPNTLAEVARLEADSDGLSSALDRAVEIGASELVVELVLRIQRMWLLTGRLLEGRRRLDDLSPKLDKPADRVRVEVLAGTFASYVNDPAVISDLRRSLESAESLTVTVDRVIVNGWCCLAALSAHHGHLADASTAADRARQMAARTDSAELVELALDVTGHVASYADDHELALRVAIECLASARTRDDEVNIVQKLVTIGAVHLERGRAADGIPFCDEAFDRLGSLRLPVVVGHLLKVRGLAHAIAGDLAVATSDLTESLRYSLTTYPDPLEKADALYALGHCAAVGGAWERAGELTGAAQAVFAEHGLASESRLPWFDPGVFTTLEAPESQVFAAAVLRGTIDPDGVAQREIAELSGQ